MDGADLFGTDEPLPALVAALEQSPTGVLLLDARGTVTFENGRFRQSVGEDADESWAGRPVGDIPGLAGPIRDAARRLVGRGIGFQDLEGTFERSDGTRRHLLVSGTSVRRVGETPSSYVLTALDVTPWREEEHARSFQARLDAAEASLRNAALASPNTLALLEAGVRSLSEAFGTPHADALVAAGSEGADEGDLYVRCASWPAASAADSVVLVADDWPALASGRPVAVRRGEPSGDALLDALSVPHALLVPFDGAARGVFLLSRHCGGPWTPAEQAAAGRLAALFSTLWAWAEAEARFHRAVADLDDALFTVGTDAAGRRAYVFVTHQVEAVTGLDPDALLSGDADWAALVHPDDRAAFEAHDARLRDGAPSHVDVRLVLERGETVWVRERATPSLDAAGRAVSGGTLADITAQKEADAVLHRARRIAERAARTRMSFLRMMSHELRTPLGAIRGFAELLEDEVCDLEAPPEVTEFTVAIRESAARALDLVSNLLDLSRLETEALDLRAIAVDLRAVVDGVAARHRAGAEARGLTLGADIGAHPVTVQGDPSRIEQVVDQLLSNAVKFTAEGGVEVRLCEADGQVRLTVSDTGVGIADDFLDGLFEPFAQEDHRVNRDFGGSGLGLAIASRLARQMNGRLSVTSEKGVGSTFTLTLPGAA